MGVERTVRIRSVYVGSAAPVGHDIDSSTQGISPEFHRYNAFIHLYTLRQTQGNVIDTEARRCPLHRYTIDEQPYMLTRKTVKINVYGRTQATIFAYFYARHAVEHVCNIEICIPQPP